MKPGAEVAPHPPRAPCRLIAGVAVTAILSACSFVSSGILWLDAAAYMDEPARGAPTGQGVADCGLTAAIEQIGRAIRATLRMIAIAQFVLAGVYVAQAYAVVRRAAWSVGTCVAAATISTLFVLVVALVAGWRLLGGEIRGSVNWAIPLAAVPLLHAVLTFRLCRTREIPAAQER